MTVKRVDVRKIFLGLQQQMCTKLLNNRVTLTHPVSKGDGSELEWEEMLGTYLPSRYRVGKAFVIDHTGAVSDQIDLVVFDRHYSPFLLKQHGATYVPAESVYAVIEVKPTLTIANLRYAAAKAASVRRLNRTSVPIIHAGGVIRRPRRPFEILAGILTTDGRMGDPARRLLNGFSAEARIDFGCSLKSGAFTARYGKRRVQVTQSGPEDALVTFFLDFLAALQSRGTVPAMDVSAYARAVSGE